MSIDWLDFKNDARILLECADALHRAPQPVRIHPSHMIEMCDAVAALVRAARMSNMGPAYDRNGNTLDDWTMVKLEKKIALDNALEFFRNIT